MDKAEFTRRIKAYLDVDFPNLADADAISEALSQRLFQYVRQAQLPDAGESATLSSLLPPGRVLLFFSAIWDGSAPGYLSVVERVARDLSAIVIAIDIDDPVGSAIARVYRIANTPTVHDARSTVPPIVGARTAEHLLEALEPT